MLSSNFPSFGELGLVPFCPLFAMGVFTIGAASPWRSDYTHAGEPRAGSLSSAHDQCLSWPTFLTHSTAADNGFKASWKMRASLLTRTWWVRPPSHCLVCLQAVLRLSFFEHLWQSKSCCSCVLSSNRATLPKLDLVCDLAIKCRTKLCTSYSNVDFSHGSFIFCWTPVLVAAMPPFPSPKRVDQNRQVLIKDSCTTVVEYAVGCGLVVVRMTIDDLCIDDSWTVYHTIITLNGSDGCNMWIV